ncbi:NADH dehydrogenase subunit E [Chitinophaga ginsengisegetis]|uniref:NADH dehydrogenase subunit E n=1 Tax=Chitinophaga ginsengisegetis TaxID=393003 RepID=A0A1T5N967_9BACT|nr:NADH-quinone oxidoreductase subunit NuoE [Chitinophaga ginsengisegetis]MDR6568440.1 NADH-quinone oxidoreductase subunit E [Chitinophaga ginsengisegetis]MDR6648329.1 NADH-quinone oxidoreductase subunit E [Chitinophaga ginsengisegetis]MDR6654521.1 NADH-quinone oxidoreductase subunit E [Chitinophaga ginsengisegetis]SKC97000.1 NADH dehydrogenase subunit E [Chitinophaga ginsengisegetis]
MLSAIEIEQITHEMQQVPVKKAACIEALKIVQGQRRWVSDESVADIAAILDMSTAEVDSVATFYNLIFRRPVGRHVILLCDSISCYVMGYTEIKQQLMELLQIKYGQTTPDERFTLLPNACLGTCDHAPAMMIDNDLYRDLTTASLSQILDQYL